MGRWISEPSSRNYRNTASTAGQYLEWECCIKDSEQGASEGAPFIANHIINVTSRAFDDFAASGMDMETNRKLLGIG